jgi:hypothetical protein
MVAALIGTALTVGIPALTSAYQSYQRNKEANLASTQTAAQAAAASQHVAKGTAADPAVLANALANAAAGTQQGTFQTALAQQMAGTPYGSALAAAMPALAASLPALLQTAVSPTGNVVQNPLQLGLSSLAQQQLVQPQQQALQQHINEAGRAQVARVASAVDPQLQAIQRQLQERKTQLEATAEHRVLERDEKRWRRLNAELNGIRRAIGDRERY